MNKYIKLLDELPYEVLESISQEYRPKKLKNKPFEKTDEWLTSISSVIISRGKTVQSVVEKFNKANNMKLLKRDCALLNDLSYSELEALSKKYRTKNRKNKNFVKNDSWIHSTIAAIRSHGKDVKQAIDELEIRQGLLQSDSEITNGFSKTSQEEINLATEMPPNSIVDLKTYRKKFGKNVNKIDTFFAEMENKKKKSYNFYSEVNAGFVYFIMEKMYGAIKVGSTRHLDQRLLNFGVKLPFEIVLVHVIFCTDAKAAEKSFHKHYGIQRLHGEWFTLDKEDIYNVKNLLLPQKILQHINGRECILNKPQLEKSN